MRDHESVSFDVFRLSTGLQPLAGGPMPGLLYPRIPTNAQDRQRTRENRGNRVAARVRPCRYGKGISRSQVSASLPDVYRALCPSPFGFGQDREAARRATCASTMEPEQVEELTRR